MPALSFDSWNISKEVDDTNGHDGNGTGLSHGIAHESHDEWEDGSTEQAHNHQTRNFVLLVWHREQCLREGHREDVRVAIAHQCDCGIEHHL